MRISDHSAGRPLAPEERRYLESVLRAENASVSALGCFFLVLILETVLISTLTIAESAHDRWAMVVLMLVVGGAFSLMPLYARKRRARRLEDTEVVTISGKLRRRSRGEVLGGRRPFPVAWPVSIGPHPVRFPRHWAKKYPDGSTLTVEVFPFPERAPDSFVDIMATTEERSSFVLAVPGERSIVREVAAGLLQVRPVAPPVLSLVLGLLAGAGFVGIASTNFFLAPGYLLNVACNDHGRRHDFANVAAACADNPGVGRFLSIEAAWLNPNDCLVDVLPGDVASLATVREQLKGRIAHVREVKRALAEPPTPARALDEKARKDLEDSALGLMVLAETARRKQAEAGSAGGAMTTADVNQAATHVLGRILGPQKIATDPMAEYRAYGGICEFIKGELFRIFDAQCRRGLSVASARDNSPSVCWQGEDVASGRAERALDAIAADMQRAPHYQGIITQATESDRPWRQIHLRWRHHRAWLVTAVALYAGIGLVLLVLLARALATLENLLVWRRLAKCSKVDEALWK
jgi:hypothetical protein